MAALTTIQPEFTQGGRHQLLETIAIVNQTAASTAVSKAVPVPGWAKYAIFVVDWTTIGGTTPSADFDINGVNVADTQPPDDGDLFKLRDGFNYTAKTAASTSTIFIGPGVTEELTGSATADDSYGLGVILPPWLVYTYTTTDSADDADYSATISVYWSA